MRPRDSPPGSRLVSFFFFLITNLPWPLLDSGGLKISPSCFYKTVAQVEDAEKHYDIDPYVDLTKTHKPIIYISPVEIFAMHAMLYDKLSDLGPERSDPLREILGELGAPPHADESQLSEAGQGEISLTLTNRHADAMSQEPDAMLKRLFMETKRLILIIVKVQQGKDLRDILTRPIAEKEEEVWEKLKQVEFGNQEADVNGGRKKSMVLVEGREEDMMKYVLPITFFFFLRDGVRFFFFLNIDHASI